MCKREVCIHPYSIDFAILISKCETCNIVRTEVVVALFDNAGN